MKARLGLNIESRFSKDYYKRTNDGGYTEEDFELINQMEAGETLLYLINNWLERMPFFEIEFWKNYQPQFTIAENIHPFWNDYKIIYQNGLTEREVTKIKDFNFIFFEKRNNLTDEEAAQLKSTLSSSAMKAALFIMLYRDFPVFQTSYQILDALVEIDHQLATWRHKHLVMVRRMIGMRMGTGNTRGRGYLEGALNQHYVFKDLAGLSTYLIERKRLPKLPRDLIKKLSYNE